MNVPISALLLAAGSSSRMGRPKAFLPIRSQPAIRHCLGVLQQSAVEEIIVVLGPKTAAAVSLLADLPVRVVHNRLEQSEMAASVRLGVQAMPPEAVGALICLVDHPLVQKQTLDELIGAVGAAPERIIIPTFGGRRGHPTYFPKGLLVELDQGHTLRGIIDRHGESKLLLPVADEGVVLDMDTPADYREVCRRLEEGQYE